MRKHLLGLLVLTALATQVPWNRSESITIVNKTGYDIQEAWLGPGCDEGEPRPLAAGKSLEVRCDGQHKNWELYLGWNDDEEDDDEFDELTPGHTYALYYDEENDVTSLQQL